MIGFPLQNDRAWTLRTAPLLLPLLLWLGGCDWRGPRTLPGQMVGEWKTDEPRYHGRFLKLETDRITFGLGGAAPDQYEEIETVRMVPKENPTDYLVKLKAENGTSDSIVLQFTSANGGELRLKNQPKVVWKRKSDPARVLPREIPQPETRPLDGIYVEHRTIYKIDCLRPKVCRSY